MLSSRNCGIIAPLLILSLIVTPNFDLRKRIWAVSSRLLYFALKAQVSLTYYRARLDTILRKRNCNYIQLPFVSIGKVYKR